MVTPSYQINVEKSDVIVRFRCDIFRGESANCEIIVGRRYRVDLPCRIPLSRQWHGDFPRQLDSEIAIEISGCGDQIP